MRSELSQGFSNVFGEGSFDVFGGRCTNQSSERHWFQHFRNPRQLLSCDDSIFIIFIGKLKGLKDKLSLNHLHNLHCLVKTIILHALLKMRQDGCQQSGFWKSCKKLALPHVKFCKLHMGQMAKATFFRQRARSLHEVDARSVAQLWMSIAPRIWHARCHRCIHVELGTCGTWLWTKFLDPHLQFSHLLHHGTFLYGHGVCMVESGRATSRTPWAIFLDVFLDEGESASQTHHETFVSCDRQYGWLTRLTEQGKCINCMHNARHKSCECGMSKVRFDKVC